MNRKQKIIVSVTGIFLVALILIGLTYAYFLTQITGNTNPTSISIQTANLRIKYQDGDNIILDENTKLIPSDEKIGIKKFSVVSEGDDAPYAVVIEKIIIKKAGTEEITTFKTNDFEYELKCTIVSEDDSRDGKSCNSKSVGTKLPLSDEILVSDNIKSGDTHNYEMTVWYKDNGDDQSDDMNKTLEARINIIDSKNTIAISGKVNGATNGDKIELTEKTDVAYVNGEEVKLLGNEEENKKVTYVDKDGNYSFVGVKPANYEIAYYKAKSTTITYKTDITIKKGTTAGVDTTNKVITITENSSAITINVNSNGFTLTEEIEIKPNPYTNKPNSLAYHIINNALNVTEENKNKGYAEYSPEPLTAPNTETIILRKDIYGVAESTEMTYNGSERYYYLTSDEYILNDDNTFSLVNPIAICPYNYYDGVSGYSLLKKYVAKTDYIYDQAQEEVEISNKKFTSIVRVDKDSSEEMAEVDGYIITYGKTGEVKSIEHTLSTTPDDYTKDTKIDSYYFRGAVENNYVDFADMCWRIVRIDGNGNTKLILQDEDDTCKTQDGNWNISASNGETVTMNGDGPVKRGSYGFNPIVLANYDDYEAKMISYLNPKQDTDKAMVNAFKYFQKQFTNSELENLEKTDWCIADKAYLSNGNLLPNDGYDYLINPSNYYGVKSLAFDSSKRLELDKLSPTLYCTGTKLNTYADNKTKMLVGTLTVDEVAFAGGVTKGTFTGDYTLETNYYLINGLQPEEYSEYESWLTLSPGHNDDIEDYVYSVISHGALFGHSGWGLLRPAVVLKAGTPIKEGNGTMEAPYVIE